MPSTRRAHCRHSFCGLHPLVLCKRSKRSHGRIYLSHNDPRIRDLVVVSSMIASAAEASALNAAMKGQVDEG